MPCLLCAVAMWVGVGVGGWGVGDFWDDRLLMSTISLVEVPRNDGPSSGPKPGQDLSTVHC